tara:strand:- start:4953 stop:5297 length:345 start_codon:yes stop_codon:yes gene_type:complete
MKTEKSKPPTAENPASTAALAAGFFLSRCRQSLGWSQRRTSRQLGISQTAWRNIELGIKPPSRSTLLKILYRLYLTEAQKKNITMAYYEHDNDGTISHSTRESLFKDLPNGKKQ